MDTFSTKWNDAAETDAAYSRMSVPAIVAFCFGLLSFLIFFSPWFGFLGALGFLFSLAAIVMIRRSEGSLHGRLFAQAGLVFSIVSLVAVTTLWPTYHYGVRREADRFFELWFQAMREGDIPFAKGLASPYWSRSRGEDPEKWWTDQYENRFTHRDIHNYVDNKLFRTMLALGKTAETSYYKTLSVESGDEKDTVVALYAVGYPGKDGKRETFFVRMKGERSFPDGDVKSAGWSLSGYPEFVVPDEFKESAVAPSLVAP